MKLLEKANGSTVALARDGSSFNLRGFERARAFQWT
jgi:hypothetical protein